MNNLDVIEPRKARIGGWTIGTFDIETNGIDGGSALLGRMVMGASYVNDKVMHHSSMASILQRILSYQNKVRWFVHNGGHFDFKYLVRDEECLTMLRERGYAIEVVGGSIAKGLMLKRQKQCILLCDSFKLTNTSLAKLAKGFGVETYKGFKTADGKYHTIDFARTEFNPSDPQHIEYLNNDVISLYQCMAKYREIINTDFGADLKMTASSTAFSAFQTILPKKIHRHKPEVSEFARKAYYGGRTECFYQGISKGVSYIDVNSLYAYIMHTYGAVHRPYFTKSYDVGVPGFYHIRCQVPLDKKFGFLPYRKPDNTGVVFPVGTFQTYASNLEIDLARENGCSVEVIEGYAFEEHDADLFKDFIDRCKALRQQDYKGAKGMVAKYLQNNLYGFFGMNPLRDELVIGDEMPEGEEWDLATGANGELLDNVFTRKVMHDTINQVPAFAAWITSAARAYLLRAMLAEEAAGNTVLYCDTDSIIMEGYPTAFMSNSEYGAFKLEYTGADFYGITAKTYMLRGREFRSVMCCKGLPKKQLRTRMFRDVLNGGSRSIQFTQLHSLSSIIKGGKYGIDDARRLMPNPNSITSRQPGKANGGWTKPLQFSEMP